MRFLPHTLFTNPFALLALLLGLTIVSEAMLLSRLDRLPVSSAVDNIASAPTLRNDLQPLVRNEVRPQDWFGAAVALTDSSALVASPRQLVAGRPTGAVHLFHRGPLGQWHPVHQFTRSELAAGANFGSAVSASAGRVLIGVCPNEEQAADAPVAYVYERLGSEWRSSPLTIDNDGPSLLNAVSLAIDGDAAIVGQVSRATDSDRLSAKACIFRARSDGTWQPIATLTQNHAATTFINSFGNAVALSGSRAIVGAPLVDTSRGVEGAAYVYQECANGQWQRIATLTADDDERANCFGCSVAIAGNTAIVGAMAANAPEMNSGAAYVFRVDDDGRWKQVAKLAPHDLENWSCFGRSVALRGDLAVVGAPGSDDGVGAIYAFRVRRSATKQLACFSPQSATPRSAFGQSASIAGSTLLAGAPWQDLADQDNTGAAYACNLAQPPRTITDDVRSHSLAFAPP